MGWLNPWITPTVEDSLFETFQILIRVFGCINMLRGFFIFLVPILFIFI
jgi:hypothetical protein